MGFGRPGGLAPALKNQAVSVANRQDRPIENKAENPVLANLRQHAAPRHKAAARAVFYAMAGGDFAALPEVLRNQLTRPELDLLAEAVAGAINPARHAWPADTAWRTVWAAACADYHRAVQRRAAP